MALFLAAAKWILALLRDIYGQFFVLVMDTLIQKPFLFILNKVEIDEHKRLTDLIGKRPRKTPLITVSNHCSSLDEPLLFSALVALVTRLAQPAEETFTIPPFQPICARIGGTRTN